MFHFSGLSISYRVLSAAAWIEGYHGVKVSADATPDILGLVHLGSASFVVLR